MKQVLRFTSLLVLWISLTLISVAAVPDKAIVGNWKSTDGSGEITTFLANHTFKSGTGIKAAAGKWSVSGRTVTLRLTLLSGKPVSATIAQLDKLAPQAASNPNAAAQIEGVKKMLKKGFQAKLSNDGKTMTATIMGKTQSMVKVK